MNILIVGGGGREHSLLVQYAKSSKVKKLYSVPGNDLMGFHVRKPVKIYPKVNATDKESIWKIIKQEKIDLVDVAQDLPLAYGMVNFLESKGIKVFGPTKEAAEIEWSKEWARNFMKRHHLPTPKFAVFSILKQAKDYVRKLPPGSFFVKASGLAAGKGAIKAESKKEVLKVIDKMKDFGEAGEKFLIEECLIGEEVSIYALSDGEHFKILKTAQDNKALYNFDEGSNTGGMGANAPALVSSDREIKKKIEAIVRKTIDGMKKEGRPYKGVLYLGLIIDKKKRPKIIEFNARWGDPEAQTILPGIKNDYLNIILACIEGKLDKLKIYEDSKTRVCVVGAGRGYPEDFSRVRGREIVGLEEAEKLNGVSIFGAGVKRINKKFFVSGGRVINVVGEGGDIFEARKRAYQAISLINIEGNNMHFRTDIGWRDVERKVKYD